MTDKVEKLDKEALTKTITEKASKAFTIDHASGTATVEGNLWKECLPESLSEDVCRNVYIMDEAFAAGTAQAFALEAIKSMSKHKSLESVSVKIPKQNRMSVSHTVHRKREYPNIQNPGEKITKYGVIRTTTHTPSGSMNAVEEIVTAAAQKALA